MKIRIITIHGIPNFGSVFQSYALCKYLCDIGYQDTKVIDYHPAYFEPRTLRSKIGKILNHKRYAVRAQKFREFNKYNIPMTEERFSNLAQLCQAEWDADLYIAGGDQLWNVYHDCGNDDAYKLTFVTGHKISYATSMGQSGFSDQQLFDLAEKIQDFSAVSVRESHSVQLLKDMGVSAVQCVDPVFLLDAMEYEKFMKPINQPKYLVVYLVTPSELLENCISYLSKKHNLKVILCSGFSKKCSCDEFIKDLGPDEILSYIKNADIVLSSSFHATAFAMIFNKQFFTILPNQHTNERIIDILTIRGLEERIITEQSDLNQVLDIHIDYASVSDYEESIIQSKTFLNKSIYQ